MSSPGRLILDFDGVVCDALIECAAVTRAGGQAEGSATPLSQAVADLTPEFIDRFTSVRPYSRTLVDFMVANVVQAPVTCRDEFTAARVTAGPSELRRQAQLATAARKVWRRDHRDEWLALHTVYPGVQDLIEHGGWVAIVSNKDADSITTILQHLQLRHLVRAVIGDCADKATAVSALTGGAASTFVDDNVENVLAVSAAPGVRAVWATWGYHSSEDVGLASARNVEAVTLSGLSRLRDAA
ncbi:HAD family hydrolase [Angustibacter sp. McL0619]|uniref:HAD family hydrolase n=1 Tax=Angustibacter sp. McL0619 TaxID=3415676 RepID=UPI003CF79989